ncbi:type I-E CRISPR-associated protein Cse2/CasB [Nocardia sp. NPDC004654]|uniref:type I-E CRISPR-associated protein Cse2/CasB n=1 Tax=Nocardia sp. NPDC004654 TaxID=3154776 RepID=UPI0033B7DE49
MSKLESRHRLDASARNLVERVERINRTSTAERAGLRRSLRYAPEDPQTRRAHHIVAPYLPPAEKRDRATERAFYTIAAMIAAQPRIARDAGDTDDGPDTDETTLTEGTQAPTDPSSAVADSAAVADTSAVNETDATSAGPTTPVTFIDVRALLGESLGVSLANAVANNLLNADSVAARLQLVCRQRVDGVHRQLPRLVAQLREKQVLIAWERLLIDLADWGRARDQVTKRWLQDYYRTLAEIERKRNNTTTSEIDSDTVKDERQ